MGWPYHFVSLDDEQQARRRQLLDSYGQFAQLSILLLPLLYQLGLGVRLLVRRLRWRSVYQPVKEHQSPVASGFEQATIGGKGNLWARIRWVLDAQVAKGWGTKKEWLAVVVWGSWLLLLVLKDTGDDYLHLTRRFGIIAASQLPLHYALALKSWSPIQYLTCLSHESLNPYHRLLGRLIITLMAIHAFMYLNFYVQNGLLLNRIRDWDVILGLTAISSALLIGTTALARVRDWNYRVFFYMHVALSTVLLPVLYLHVSHLRVYILEAAAIYAILILQRNVDQASAQATIKLLPGTNLLSITIPLTKKLSGKMYKPGQHIYLGFPSLPQKLRINPFSIANPRPNDDKNIHLVARALNGTTAILADLATKPQLTHLLIEGPYGSAAYFPNFSAYDRILFVAGGVGATFTLPLYQDLLRRSAAGEHIPRLRFVWTVKNEADAQWGIDQLHSQSDGPAPGEFQLYVTGGTHRNNHSKSDGSIELQERESLLDGSEEVAEALERGRPDLRAVVDEVFSHESSDRVAVLVCGPSGMGASVRREVGRWVWKGRDLWWHSEEFGW